MKEIEYARDIWELSKTKRTIASEVEVSTSWAWLLLQMLILINWFCLLSGYTVLACISERVPLLIISPCSSNHGNFLVVPITENLQDIPIVPLS